MNANEILDMIGDAKGAYIWDARQPRRNRAASRERKSPVKRLWLAAAIAALMLLLVGCVAYVLSLGDMALGKEDRTYYDGSSQTVTLFSLQGVKGTPAYQASKEWYDWLQTYDTDQSIRFSDQAFSEDFGDEYYAYSLYSREMKDKLDEICAKYGLSLLGKMYVDPDVEAGCQALQIQGILRPGAQAETDWGLFRYYANGSYDVEGYMTLTAPDTPWPYEKQIVSFSCTRKDAFSELLGDVGPEGTYDEWNYTNADGVELLMVIDHSGVRENSLILADQGPYTFLFSIHDMDDGQHPMTKEGLEAYAEVFDFTARPQPVTQEDLQAADQRREQANQDFAEEQDKMAHSFSHLGYEDRIKFQLEYALYPNQLGFAVLDLEGNGSQDLLVGENGYIRAVYTTRDDGTQHMMPLDIGYVNSRNLLQEKGIGANGHMFYSYIYLCEGNSLAYAYDLEGGGKAYHFASVKNGEMVWTNRVSYHPNDPYYASNPWVKHNERSRSESITEEEFNRIVQSYKRVILDMHPISQYPLADHSPSGIGKPPETYNSYDDLAHSRGEWGSAQDHSRWAFCLTDLDGDGQEELIWKEDNWMGVFTMQGGQVQQLAGGQNLVLCQGGVIAQTITYLDGNQTCCYYQIQNGNAVLTDYLRYDVDKNPENPWLQSADLSGQDYSMAPISQAEYDAIRAKYTPTEPNWRPVSEYPG